VTLATFPPSIVVTLSVPEDRFAAARAARALAKSVGLSPTTSLQIAVAVSELAANAVRHGGGGVVRLSIRAKPHPGIEVYVADRGLGRSPTEEDFVDGFSEQRMLGPDAPRRPGQGLGIGLGAVRRFMDEVRVIRPADGGHVIVAARWTER
jgi:serine/threonine-protein kinase RsbT